MQTALKSSYTDLLHCLKLQNVYSGIVYLFKHSSNILYDVAQDEKELKTPSGVFSSLDYDESKLLCF